MIYYDCPSCGAVLDAPSSLAGQRDDCPGCGAILVVPASGEGAAGPAAVATGPAKHTAKPLAETTAEPTAEPLADPIIERHRPQRPDSPVGLPIVVAALAGVIGTLAAIAAGWRRAGEPDPDPAAAGLVALTTAVIVTGLALLAAVLAVLAQIKHLRCDMQERAADRRSHQA